MPLNDRQIKNAKPSDKPYKLTDGGGLHLVVTPAGGKLWRLKYRIDGKEKLLSIGKYPAVALIEARQAAEDARRMMAAGRDPAAAKQQAKAERSAALANLSSHSSHSRQTPSSTYPAGRLAAGATAKAAWPAGQSRFRFSGSPNAHKVGVWAW